LDFSYPCKWRYYVNLGVGIIYVSSSSLGAS
jgi:hypothetical protein